MDKSANQQIGKTALALTPQEWRAYRPGVELDSEQVAERWERAWEVAHAAARVLRETFGARRVVAFGSLAHRSSFTQWSDIDLAAWGVPAPLFYRAVAVITGLSPEFEIDLLDPDTCRPALLQRIEEEGIEL